MSACKYCGYRGRLAAGSFCSLTCEALQRVYQRGRDEERALALSGADAYLKQAITEAEGGSVMKVWLVWQGELGGERNFEGVFRTEEGAIQRVSEINDDGFPRAKDVKWYGKGVLRDFYIEIEEEEVQP